MPHPKHLLVTLALLAACSGVDGSPPARSGEAPPTGGRLFTMLPSDYTGVRFENRLTETREQNVFTYRNFYNGGGVALGDLTGDGLPEMLLTANQGPNRLYLNEGDFRFRDITEQAGLADRRGWATGVTFADVNGDGWLDIYVCYAAGASADDRANALYVHRGLDARGLPTFDERALSLGIADSGYSTHAAFFDYDRDGALDLYVVNNSPRPVSSFGLRNTRHVRHPLGGDKLFRNVGGRFVDVSEQAGIFGPEFAFGLGVAVGDVNRDGWPDIYVSNDFFERDYLYINDGDGTFTESLESQMASISFSSMGLDIADLDNDGWLDLYVTDMLPEDDYRLKTTSSFEEWEGYQTKLANGYHHQFMRNMLHRNNGNGTFSELGQLAGVARTDWSWSALIADLDLDGNKDIHVTNGILRDVTSQDYVAFLASDETMAAAAEGERVDFLKLVEATTSTPLPNYAFRNEGNLAFANPGDDWGLNTRAFSSGAAYGDLNADGALDLVVNNVNAEASVYRNNARTLTTNRFLQIRLDGESPNRFGIGAKITVRAGGRSLFQEQMPSRGFQSSVDYVMTFGLAEVDTVESVIVEWPDGSVTTRNAVPANQRITVAQSQAGPGAPPASPPRAVLFVDVTDSVAFPFSHQENAFVDFRRERLMPKMLSLEGPFLAVADVNGDGLDDLFIGGAKDQAGRLLLQQRDGGFASTNDALFDRDRVSEDLGAAFFDANGDGHPDLYVVSGGSEFSDLAPALQDRLYLNDGRGGFRKGIDNLPALRMSGSRVAAADFDRDGDVDLFVGGRVVPWRYGLDPASALLANDGRGTFRDVTGEVAPDLAHIGMVTDALWHDLDRDGLVDLVVVGEWMPITVFRNEGSGRLERMELPGLDRSHGWWNRIVAHDVTGDGRTDFILGNLGLNTRLQAAADAPTTMYVGDFDGNGFVEQIVTVGGRGVPLALRDDLLRALPYLAERYPTYESYADQEVTDLFSEERLAAAVRKHAYTFATALASDDGDGSFTLIPLPCEAQIAPVYGILADDVDEDGIPDLLLAGNFDGVEPEIGRMSASYGLLLRGDGGGSFTAVRAAESGFVVSGQARDIQRVGTRRGDLYVVTRNDDRPVIFRSRDRRTAAAGH